MSTFDNIFTDLSRSVMLDKHDLDNQLTEHAELYRQVCDHLALYTSQRDQAKRSLEEVEAKIDGEVREDAAATKEKMTEAAIKQRIILDERVIAAKDKLAELALTVGRLQGLEKSYIERRHAFAKLVDLHGNQYWSEHSGIARGNKAVGESRRERVKEVIKSTRER